MIDLILHQRLVKPTGSKWKLKSGDTVPARVLKIIEQGKDSGHRVKSSSQILKLAIFGKEVNAQYLGDKNMLASILGKTIQFTYLVAGDDKVRLVFKGFEQPMAGKEDKVDVPLKSGNDPKGISLPKLGINQLGIAGQTLISQILLNYSMFQGLSNSQNTWALLPFFLLFHSGESFSFAKWKKLEKNRLRFSSHLQSNRFRKKLLNKCIWFSLDRFLSKIPSLATAMGNSSNILLRWFKVGLAKNDKGNPQDPAMEEKRAAAIPAERGSIIESLPLNQETPIFLSENIYIENFEKKIQQFWMGNWPEYISLFWPKFDKGDLTVRFAKKGWDLTIWFHNQQDFQDYSGPFMDWFRGHDIWKNRANIVNGHQLLDNLEPMLKENPQNEFWG